MLAFFLFLWSLVVLMALSLESPSRMTSGVSTCAPVPTPGMDAFMSVVQSGPGILGDLLRLWKVPGSALECHLSLYPQDTGLCWKES